MDTRRLRAFIAVAEQLSFRRAAEVLRVPQPSLSQQIRALENDLGVALFHRVKGRIHLTNAGAQYLADVRGLVDELDASARRARDARDGALGTLQLGSTGMAMIDDVPRVVRSFRTRYPAVATRLTILRQPDIVTELRERRIDVALTDIKDDEGSFAREPLWCYPYRVVLPVDHPAAVLPEVELSRLAAETLIVHARRGPYSANAGQMRVCEEQHFVPKETIEVPEVADLETLLGLVACGLGIAILPSPYERLAPPTVVLKPIAGSTLALRIWGCWRSGEANPLVEHFIDCARTMARAG